MIYVHNSHSICVKPCLCDLTPAGCIMADVGNDDGSNWEDECRQLESEDECLEAGCEWINEDGCYSNWNHDDNWDDGHDEESPPECLMDCEGIENVNPEENPYESCDWIISNFGQSPNNFINQCAEDCDNEIMMEINEYMEVCFQCLADNNCEDVFHDDNWDDELSCSDINNPNECYSVGCEWIHNNNTPTGGSCIESNEDNEDWEDDCRQFESEDECLEAGCEWINEDGCYSNWNHDDNDCNPELICAEVETCIDGFLYPTSCGPENCDEPIGECNELGVLYGYVEYIWGDAIEMVANAHIQVEHIYSNSIIFQTYTNDSGAYEILVPPGSYIITVSVYEDSQSTGIEIESYQQYELNFQLGEWSWPEPQAILSLGNGNGNQEGFTVPLYLQTDTSVSGLQFAVLPEYTGGGFWFTPIELESTNDCFSASFNEVYGQLWGIMFSLEGCAYEPGEHHIANLSFATGSNSSVPPGTDIQLVFNYTLVSDPGANEIPSSGEGSMVTFGQLGDVDNDGTINVLDIVNMVNFALQIDEPTDYELWSADLNQDGDINVLDVISAVNIILYEDDLQRTNSGDAEIYQNEKEVHIEGSNVAGFQIVFSEDVDINQIQIPDGWISKYHNNSLIAYTFDGNLLNSRSIIKLNENSEISDIIISDAQGNMILAHLEVLPQWVALKDNYPNPFNPQTTISYTLPKYAMVELSIYDLSGRMIESLVNSKQYPGEFSVSWTANGFPSGIYIARLIVDGEVFTKKMMLMK